MNAWEEKHGLPRSLGKGVKKLVVPDTREIATANLNKLLWSINAKAESSDFSVFLTGENNYRETIEVKDKYKGNRDPLHKPYHYEHLRDYLIHMSGTEVVDGQEADDAMGIAQCEALYTQGFEETIICTKDKDLDMIPGWHYNWASGVRYWVDEEEANRHFYSQLLTGDQTDNIKGIKGIGPVTAEKLLRGLSTPEDMFAVVLREYAKAGLDGKTLLATGQLLWIRRQEGEMWFPPEVFLEEKEEEQVVVKYGVGDIEKEKEEV